MTRAAGAVAGIAVVNRDPFAYAREGTPAADEFAEFATIVGVVTDTETGDPLADVYVAVGWQSVQRIGISDEEGRSAVDTIPATEAEKEVDLLGFREGGFRYHTSRYAADTLFTLEPGETVSYDFTLTPLPEERQPEVSDAVIDPRQAAPAVSRPRSSRPASSWGGWCSCSKARTTGGGPPGRSRKTWRAASTSLPSARSATSASTMASSRASH